MKKTYFLMVYLCAMTLFGQGTETFSNLLLTASYSDGDFEGNNGITWNYVHCRNVTSTTSTTGTLEKMSLPAILLRDESSGSSVFAMSGINGVGQVRMKLYKAYTSSTLRQIDLYVNNILVGTSVGFNDEEEHEFLITDINVSGNVRIEIKNTKSVQIVVDNIEWSSDSQVLSVTKSNIEGFSIYPNPVKGGIFRIMSSNHTLKSILVYDMLGKQVFSQKVMGNDIIDVNNLNAGIYILKVEEQGKVATRKLVIE